MRAGRRARPGLAQLARGAARPARSPAVAALRRAHRDRVAFHAWLQWLLDVQLRAATGEHHRASRTCRSASPAAAPTPGPGRTCWPRASASGAPPDAFNSHGPGLGLAAAGALAAARGRTTSRSSQSIRATMAGAGGLRIDHVMGLFRLWWMPAGRRAPADGAYVRYPHEDLLDIVALESHRARRDRRRRGPRHRRARRPRGAGRARHPVLPAARGSRTTTRRGWPRRRDGRGHHPRPADRRRAVDRGRPRRAARARPRHRRGARARPRLAAGSTCGDVPATATPAEAVERRLPAAGHGALHAAVGHPGGRRGRGAPAEHAGHHRPAQLVPAAAGADRGAGRATPASRRVARVLGRRRTAAKAGAERTAPRAGRAARRDGAPAGRRAQPCEEGQQVGVDRRRPGWSACRAGSRRRSSACRSAAAPPTAARSRRTGRSGRRRRA